jgi:mono/diheme cytochrome c family protein
VRHRQPEAESLRSRPRESEASVTSRWGWGPNASKKKLIAVAASWVVATALAAGQGRQGPPPQGRGGGAGTSAGSADKHVVDSEAADRGRKIYAAECITCHGTQARGSDTGANLVHAVLVLHDRYGSELGPFLKKGHPMQSGRPSASLTEAQVKDLSHFIHQRVYETLRSSPTFEVGDVLVGDREAGAKFFNGEGRCATCHSPAGDFKGIGSKYPPPALQQRIIFPRSGRGAKPATVTVTPAGGEPVSGTLVAMDDFTVALRDAGGRYRSFKRSPGLSVTKQDPYAAHYELLDRITDQNMHDLVAYLARLK